MSYDPPYTFSLSTILEVVEFISLFERIHVFYCTDPVFIRKILFDSAQVLLGRIGVRIFDDLELSQRWFGHEFEILGNRALIN